MPTFKNEAELKKALMKKCVEAVTNTERKVHKELDDNLNQFYTEFEPDEYIRTCALYNSLKTTGVKQVGNQHMSRVEAEVYFDTPSYERGFMELQGTPWHGMHGFATWSGEKVLNVAMTDNLPHGRYIGGTPIWTKSMKNLGGKQGIKTLLKQELKKQGL